MATPTTAGPSGNSKTAKKGHPRGSGHDLNSDTARLHDEQNMQDKTVEDSFPASDPASNTPVSGVGATRNSWSEDSQNPAGTPKDFKDNKAAQFEYGRRTEAKTFNYEQNTNRFRKGNPDVGNVDLGNIEAGKPADPDDNDPND